MSAVVTGSGMRHRLSDSPWTEFNNHAEPSKLTFGAGYLCFIASARSAFEDDKPVNRLVFFRFLIACHFLILALQGSRAFVPFVGRLELRLA